MTCQGKIAPEVTFAASERWTCAAERRNCTGHQLRELPAIVFAVSVCFREQTAWFQYCGRVVAELNTEIVARRVLSGRHRYVRSFAEMNTCRNPTLCSTVYSRFHVANRNSDTKLGLSKKQSDGNIRAIGRLS